MAEALGAGAVGVGQVGDGELALLCVARVAVLGQRLRPVPDLRCPARGLDAELVVQADLGDAVDVAQALGCARSRVAVQAALEGGDDLGAVQARCRAGRAPPG